MYTVSLWKYSVCSRICLFGILIAHCIGCTITYWNGIVESSSISYYAVYTVSLWKYSVCSRICLFGILIAHCIGCTYWNGIVESSSISYFAVYTVSLWYLPFLEFWLLIVLVGGVSWRPLLHTADPWWFNCVKVIFEIVQKKLEAKKLHFVGWVRSLDSHYRPSWQLYCARNILILFIHTTYNW